MAKNPPKTERPGPLKALVSGDPRGVIALMLWKNRLREPDMYVQIDEKDIAAFRDCVNYLKMVPEVIFFQPEGLPAQAAIPATGNRRAVPARDAIPPKPYVIVTLVEKGTRNVIKPIENNEVDYDRSLEVAQIRRAKDNAPTLAQRLIQQAQTGEYSLSDMQDAANALVLLARGL